MSTKADRKRNAAIVRRLALSLVGYVSADDTTLQRLEFLKVVRDRLRDDLKAAARIQQQGIRKQRRVE